MRIAEAIRLTGSPYQRGYGQAAHGKRSAIRRAIDLRLDQTAPLLSTARARDYLAEQWRFAAENCEPELDEMCGVADAFSLDRERLFAFLHLGILSDFEGGTSGGDGCTAWAMAETDTGPAVGKNRDFRGEHAGLQAVFEQRGPPYVSYAFLCIGSLGCPGAYSSGLNQAGLAVADTQIATPDHGIGWLRYFLMTRLLSTCSSVAEAVEFLRRVRHAGGGSLVLADADGTIAAADLGHDKNRVDAPLSTRNGRCVVTRTNHFRSGSVRQGRDTAPMRASSHGRLDQVAHALRESDGRIENLLASMASHDDAGTTGLCRHGQDGDARTLSSAVFACRDRALYYCPGNPCETAWKRIALHAGT